MNILCGIIIILLSLVGFIRPVFIEFIYTLIIFSTIFVDTSSVLTDLPHHWWESTIGKIIARVVCLIFICLGIYLILA